MALDVTPSRHLRAPMCHPVTRPVGWAPAPPTGRGLLHPALESIMRWFLATRIRPRVGSTRRRATPARRPACWLVAPAGLAALAAVLVLGVAATPAAAHTDLVWSSPIPGQHFASTSPERLELAFTEKLQKGVSTVELLTAAGTAVPTGAPDHPPGDETTLHVSVRSPLPPGSYTVAWRVVSADGHPLEGSWAFAVGEPIDAAGRDGGEVTGSGPAVAAMSSVQPPAGTGSAGIVHTAVRWAGFVAYAMLVGTAFFVAMCWPAGRHRSGVRRLAWGGWGLSLLSTASAAVVAGPHVAALPLARALDPALLSATLGSRTGAGLIARGVLLLAAAPLLHALLRPGIDRAAAPSQRRHRAGAVLLLGAALACTWSATGHSGFGHGVAVAVPADAAHLVAMAVWTGGLVVLLVGLRGSGADDALRLAVARFSTVALTAVVVLIVTGSYQTWRQVRSLTALTGTDYGRLLTTKVIAVVAVLLVAAVSRRSVRRARQAATVTRRRAAPDVGALRRSVGVEAGIATSVVALSAVLIGLEPARLASAQTARVPTTSATASRPPAEQPEPTALPFDAGGGPAGRGLVLLDVQPGRAGHAVVHLGVVDETSAPHTTGHVQLTARPPGAATNPLPVELRPAGPGHFTGTVRLSATGVWELTVTVRTSPTHQASVRRSLTVTG